jgi:hypothetical protein
VVTKKNTHKAIATQQGYFTCALMRPVNSLLTHEIDLTQFSMWINLAIKTTGASCKTSSNCLFRHTGESRYPVI